MQASNLATRAMGPPLSSNAGCYLRRASFENSRNTYAVEFPESARIEIENQKGPAYAAGLFYFEPKIEKGQAWRVKQNQLSTRNSWRLKQMSKNGVF
jgi:hypothetical protein